MNAQNLPYVKTEGDITKTYKLITVPSFIILLLLLLLYNYVNGSYITYKHPSIHNVNINSRNILSSNTIIHADSIRIISTKQIPVVCMYVLDNNNKLQKYTNNIIIKTKKDNIFILEYMLDNIVDVRDIIIEIDINNNYSKNIIDAVVEIINNNKIVWISPKKLSYNRYNKLSVYKQHYNDLSDNTFCNPNLSLNDEESLLNNCIIKNIN